jgi:hypothetical protein
MPTIGEQFQQQPKKYLAIDNNRSKSLYIRRRQNDSGTNSESAPGKVNFPGKSEKKAVVISDNGTSYCLFKNVFLPLLSFLLY